MKANKQKIVEPLINDEIRGYKQVRVIYQDPLDNSKSFNKIVSLYEAKTLAKNLELDIVEINPKSDPPILKIVNYSKFLFDLKKNAKQKKKTSQIKEIKITTNICEHDIDTKVRQAKSFIEDGDKVKITLTMKGRELTRRDESKKSIFVFINKMSDFAIPETMPRDEGNKSIVILKGKK